MKKLFTLFALLTVFLGAKAATITDAEVKFSTSTITWKDGAIQEDWLFSDDDGLHCKNPEAIDWWAYQLWICGNMDLTVDDTYTITFVAKVDGGSAKVRCKVGNWGGGITADIDVNSTDYQEYTFEGKATTASNGFFVQFGDYVGTISFKSIKITHEGQVERPAEWVEILTNGDAEKSWEELGLDPHMTAGDDDANKICFWTKEKGTWDKDPKDGVSGDAHPAVIENIDGNNVFVCHAKAADSPNKGDEVVSAWDNQIWIESPRAWKTGEQFKLSFRYKASQDVTTNSQYHAKAPGAYLHWSAIGDISFTTEWQTYEGTITVPSEANGAYSIALNLNPNVKDPVDFYFDDFSWQEMKLDHGLFVAATHTESGLVPYNYAAADELVLDETTGLLMATVGTKGDPDSWVNEVTISTVRGNSNQFRANSVKVTSPVLGNEYVEDPEEAENWNKIIEAANSKITLPAAGVWNIYLDPEMDPDSKTMEIVFILVEGEAIKEPVEIVANPTEIIVNAVERDWLVADKDGNAQEDEIGEGQHWDNQLCIMANRPLKAGEVVIIEFDYWADTEAKSGTQCGGKDPGAYVHWGAIGDVDFTTEPQHFTKEYTVPSEAAGMQSLTFNLAVMKGANNYHVSNFVWCNAEKTETLIDMEGTTSFYVKEGAGTIPYEFGTENPNEIPDAIKTINVATVKSGKYNDGTKIVIVRNGKSYNVAGVEVK